MATTVLPDWLWGGKPLDFLRAAGLRGRPGPGGLQLRTQETYFHRRRPYLIDDSAVVDWRGQRQAGFHSVGNLSDPGIEEPIFRDLVERGLVPDRMEGNDLPTLLHHLRIDLSLASAEDLPRLCEKVAGILRERVVGNDDERVLPNVSVHLISRSKVLVYRVKLISVLVRLFHDKRLAGGDVSQVLADHEGGRRLFDSSAGLGDGVYVMDAYLAPLMAALSPAIWAVSVSRIHGTIIMSLGRPLSGSAPIPNELFRTLATVGPESSAAPEPFISAEAPSAAIAWWAERLDRLFAVLTDPEVFEGPAGEYVSTVALQNLLSVEQVFRRVNSILVAHHDAHARRPAFFTVMDTLTTLNRWTVFKMADYNHARGVLERLTESMPESAQEILLPAARRGLTALRVLQDGFFLRETDGKVRIRSDRPALGIVAATAKYVDMLRDATHGFTTVRGGVSQREEVATMVAIHNGVVPHDLGLLAWLYLLDLLDNPERLRRIVSADAKR